MTVPLSRRALCAAGALIPALLAGVALVAQSPAPDAGPSPDRVILTWDGDPATTQTVSWRTATPSAKPQGQIALLTSSPRFEAETVAGAAVPGAGRYVVRFGSLRPATRYQYRVGDGSSWTEWHTFRTASPRPEPFRFLYFGDAQNNIRSLWSRVARTAFTTAPDARFMIHAGDLVADGFDDNLWAEWCAGLGFIGASIPSLPAPGNHDLHPGPNASDALNPLRAPDPWRQHFALPDNGPQALRGQAYYLDYQGVRLIALDTNPLKEAAEAGSERAQAGDQELAWLEAVLRDNPNRWTVVFSHHPVYPVAKRRVRFIELERRLVPLYDKYGVDLVLQGHDHGYGRTYKLRGGKVVSSSEAGTVYAVSVSGTKMYEVGPPVPEVMARTTEGAQLFQVVSVGSDRLSYRSYILDGTVMDTVEIRKRRSAR